MSAAAKRLNLSQPAVSSAIARLESQLNVTLFDRSSRPIALTMAGRMLKKKTDELFALLEEIPGELTAVARGKLHELRLGQSNSVSECIMPGIVAELPEMADYLTLYTGSTPQIAKMLAERRVDIAICTDPLAMNADIRAIELYREDYFVVTSRDFSKKTELSGSDLQRLEKMPLVQFNPTNYDHVQTERLVRALGVHHRQIWQVDTNASILSLCAAHNGWSILPALGLLMAKDELSLIGLHTHDNVSAQRVGYLMYADESFAHCARTLAERIGQYLTEQLVPQMTQADGRLGNALYRSPTR